MLLPYVMCLILPGNTSINDIDSNNISDDNKDDNRRNMNEYILIMIKVHSNGHYQR